MACGDKFTLVLTIDPEDEKYLQKNVDKESSLRLTNSLKTKLLRRI